MNNSSPHSDAAKPGDRRDQIDVSLVMPLLNAMPYLSDALDSLKRQGHVSIEVIAVDAGSTDGTRDLLNATDFVSVIDAPGTSQTESLNVGFSECTGDIFAWLNGDDILSDGALQWVVNWFGQNPQAQLLYGDSMAVNSKGRQYGLRSNVRDGQYELLLHGDFIVQPSAFWRREVFEAVGPLDETLNFTFDYAFFLEVASQWQLHYEPVVFSSERVHGSAKTSNGGELRARELAQIMTNHGRDGVPMAFQPEVSAVEAQAAIRMLRSGEREQAIPLLRNAASQGKPRRFTVAHLFASLVAGPRGTAEARLVSNFLRSVRRRRTATWPSEEHHTA